MNQPHASLSDTGVMKILGDHVGPMTTESSEEPVVPQRDRLSDTGVMRILGDASTNPEMSQASQIPALRSCPSCSVGISDAVSVCNHCHCYVGVSPDYLRAIGS